MLAISVMVNIAYMVREKEYTMVVENTHGGKWKINFKSVYAPVMIDAMTTKHDSLFAVGNSVDYYFTNSFDNDELSVYYKIK